MQFYLLGRGLIAKLISHQPLSKALQQLKRFQLWMSLFLYDYTTSIMYWQTARVLYALYILRSHGMPPSARHAIFQSTAFAMIAYAAPAWWGFKNSAERYRVEAFVRRAIKYGYCAHSNPTVASLCDQSDQRLLATVTQDNAYPLQQLLSPKKEKHYSTRARPHNYSLRCHHDILPFMH